MRRRVQVKEGGVSKLLPFLIRTDQDDSCAPELAPRLSILPSQAIEARAAPKRGERGRLPMRLIVVRARNQRRDLSDSGPLILSGPQSVRRRQRCLLFIVFVAVHLAVPQKLGPVRGSNPRQG